MKTILLLICLLIPHDRQVVYLVDVVELNHCYGAKGNHLFDQLIFWHWYSSDSQHHVSGWVLFKGEMRHPQRDYRQGGWETIIPRDGKTIYIRSISYRETWTKNDPEVDDRANVPLADRPEIFD